MAKSKIAITIDAEMVGRVDRLVRSGVYTSRSQAVESAVREKLDRIDRTRLARELSKLDRDLERSLAEEGLSVDLESWPEY